jgi:hypothetical protein
MSATHTRAQIVISIGVVPRMLCCVLCVHVFFTLGSVDPLRYTAYDVPKGSVSSPVQSSNTQLFGYSLPLDHAIKFCVQLVV